MFIFEAVLKYLKKDRFSEILEEHDQKQSENLLNYIPLEEDIETPEDTACEHIFMPIDSTGEILACTKCGELKKRSEISPLNIFKNKNST